jgi:hypothetical protein
MVAQASRRNSQVSSRSTCNASSRVGATTSASGAPGAVKAGASPSSVCAMATP